VENLRAIDLAKVRLFLEEMAAPCDLTTFGSVVLPAVQKLVPSVVVCYAQIDPARGELVRQETFPSLSGFTSDGSFDEYMFDHPVFQEWSRTGESSALKTSDFYSARQWHKFGLYQLVYKQWGCEDSLAVGLPAPDGLIACICSERDKAFTERERLLIDLVRPHLAQTYRSAELLSLLEVANNDDGLRSMVIDKTGRPLVAPKSTWELLEQYFPDTGPLNWSLPESVLTWLVGQLAVVGRELDSPAIAQPLVIHRRDGWTLTLRILVGRLTGDQAVLLIQESASDAFETLAAELGLTRREREVLDQIKSGRTPSEIADSLFISKRTVDKHLENVYGKLGVQSRPAAVAKTLLL